MFSWLKDGWKLSVEISKLLEAQEKTNKALAKIAGDIELLRDRVTALEAREGTVVLEAKSAAAAAATLVSVQTVADLQVA